MVNSVHVLLVLAFFGLVGSAWSVFALAMINPERRAGPYLAAAVLLVFSLVTFTRSVLAVWEHVA